MSAGIDFSAVAVERGGVTVVADAAGRFEAGRWSGLIGANGSGKTSLLQTLGGRLPLARGVIRLGGVDRSADRMGRAARIGFAPDISALPGGLTGRQYIGLVRRGADPTDPDRRLARLRDALRFEPFADRPIATMSAGMRQRIAIYAAFADDAPTIILDEPFNWLDPVCAHDVKNALRALISEHGITLITALHELSTLTIFCDAGLLMSHGRIVRTLTKDDLARGGADIARFEAEMVDQLRSPPAAP